MFCGVVLELVDADRPLRRGALPAGWRIVEHVERVGAVKKLAPGVRIFLSIELIRGSRKAANPAGVPIVQSRIAPSGMATVLAELGCHREHLVDQSQHLLDTV